MSVNMFNGIIIPVDVVEGAITITETVSVTGDKSEPSLAAKVEEGDAVAITGDFQVEKATGSNGVVIGFVHDHPEYEVDPTHNYTKTQAVNAGMLRKCGVETTFVDVRTVPAKASESITPGMYVEWSADGWKKTASSGTTKSDAIALTTQGTDNIIVVGLK